jgi:hypothetical protein
VSGPTRFSGSCRPHQAAKPARADTSNPRVSGQSRSAPVVFRTIPCKRQTNSASPCGIARNRGRDALRYRHYATNTETGTYAAKNDVLEHGETFEHTSLAIYCIRVLHRTTCGPPGSHVHDVGRNASPRATVSYMDFGASIIRKYLRLEVDILGMGE